jgi:hypothetical protein
MPPQTPHSLVANWAIVARSSPGSSTPALHVVLSPRGELDGEPYIGTDLTNLDLVRGTALNCRGKLVMLEGPAQPPGDVASLPGPLQAMMRRAQSAWGLGPIKWVRHDVGNDPNQAP